MRFTIIPIPQSEISYSCCGVHRSSSGCTARQVTVHTVVRRGVHRNKNEFTQDGKNKCSIRIKEPDPLSNTSNLSKEADY